MIKPCLFKEKYLEIIPPLTILYFEVHDVKKHVSVAQGYIDKLNYEVRRHVHMAVLLPV